jgi:hypothetical protein
MNRFLYFTIIIPDPDTDNGCSNCHGNTLTALGHSNGDGNGNPRACAGI